MSKSLIVSVLSLSLVSLAHAQTKPAAAPAPAKAPAAAPAPAKAPAAAPAKPGAAAPAAAAPAGPSVGQMIASKAPLPTKMAEVMTAVADMLEAHAALVKAGKTKEGAKEAAGLKKVAADHRALAKLFTKTAANMGKATSWPAAPPDMNAMASDPAMTAAMQKMIATHKEMIALMQKEVAEMEAHSKMMMKK
jgi:2-oxoglutarate dehydrogenase E2 component (dihydrolipoamide succinyltransferase)